MRILHAVRSDAFAGVERFVSRLAAAQADHGDEVIVVGGDPADMAATLPATVAHHPARTTAQVARQVRGNLRFADVVNAHMTAAEAGSALAERFVRGARPPLVATRHFAVCRGGTGLRRWLAAPVLSRMPVDAQIAVSRFVAEHIDGPSVVVHTGVPDGQPVDPADRARSVLMVQRLEREKATAEGILAFARSGLAHQGWRLQIVGEGSQRAELERVAAFQGVGAVVAFLGHRLDIARLMRGCSIVLATTPFEGFGLAVVEAMAEGTPVVAPASGAYRETLGSVPGARLFGPGDAEAAAALLAGLAADPIGCAAYGSDLQRTQRVRFSMQQQYEQTDAVYRSLR